MELSKEIKALTEENWFPIMMEEIGYVKKEKAIPIEWIEDYVQDHWRTTKLYATDYVWQMLADWEEENETNKS